MRYVPSRSQSCTSFRRTPITHGRIFGCGIFPPISPNDSPREVADFYRDNTDLIRAGLLFSFVAFGLWGPFMAADQTRDRLLDAAERLLARLGYQKTTMEDLAREAGFR